MQLAKTSLSNETHITPYKLPSSSNAQFTLPASTSAYKYFDLQASEPKDDNDDFQDFLSSQLMELKQMIARSGKKCKKKNKRTKAPKFMNNKLIPKDSSSSFFYQIANIHSRYVTFIILIIKKRLKKLTLCVKFAYLVDDNYKKGETFNKQVSQMVIEEVQQSLED